MRLVIDASIAIKWVVQEPGTDDALALRRHHLLAPDLLVAECANILWKKQTRGEVTADEAAAAASLLERADIDLAPMRPLLNAATRIAISLDHPAYDCVYLALAQASSIQFATADARFLNKVRQTPAASSIVSLAEAAALRG